MNTFDPHQLLKDLFTRLNQSGVQLGGDELLAALRAVDGGFGATNLDDLKNVALLLWCHSPSSEHSFEIAWRESKPASEPPTLDTPMPKAPIKPSRRPKGKPTLALTAPRMRSRGKKIGPSRSFAPVPLRTNARNDVSFGNEMFGYDLPMTRRVIIHSWRRLRRPVIDARQATLDITATIDRVTRQGFFVGPLYRPTIRNRAHVVLLVDQGGSMTPFHYITRALVATALHEGNLEHIDIFYFHNVPNVVLYTDPHLLHSHPLVEGELPDQAQAESPVLSRISRDTSLLIISDAGAARGTSRDKRINTTVTFIQTLMQYTHLVAWLNPMPLQRWRDTSAEAIARYIPMFPLNIDGLRNAIDVVRGQLQPFND